MNEQADPLSVCNSILDEDERVAIMRAAMLMHEGKVLQAEYARSDGRYSFRYRKQDRQGRGLPRTMRDWRA